MNAFNKLHPAIQHHIVNTFGWSDLREVQSSAIDAFLTGANLTILAPTAGGKTEAAFFPIISRMLEDSWRGLSVIYISPIKALLNNQQPRIDRYLRLVGRRAEVWHGDSPKSQKRTTTFDPPDCLLTTPESLESILVSRRIDHRRFFEQTRVVVVDELHAFANDDRGWHLSSVLARIGRIADRDLQRIGLSATVGNPHDMLNWLSAGSDRPKQVIRPAGLETKRAEVTLDYVGSLENAAEIISLLHQGEKRLVFCDSRSSVERLSTILRKLYVKTYTSHSCISADERRLAEEAFSNERDCVIVATSTLELGIDIGDLDRVIQIDAPSSVASFLQRMGRTGRRDETARNCLFLATDDDGLLRAGAIVDLWRRGFVEDVHAPQCPYHILAQQLMALILQESGIGRSQWFEWIDSVPAFAEISPSKIDSMIDYMLEMRILWSDEGFLGFAPEGESTFGRRNFMEILSVITSEPLFRVMFGRKELGFVDQATFYRRAERPVVLSLAGRSWSTVRLDWKRRIAYVEPAAQIGRSRWLSDGRLLSEAVCQSVRSILASGEEDASWSKRAKIRFKELRDDYSWVSTDSTSLVEEQSGEVHWWTFAGGVANTMLADSIESLDSIKHNNLELIFPSSISIEDVARLIDRLDAVNVRATPDQETIESLKFSECLSYETAAEVFISRFDDRESVRRALTQKRRLIKL